MFKKFIEWCQKKIEIEKKTILAHFKKREIYWTRIGENIGFEQSGKGENFLRPVLVFRKFNNRVFWGLPLTTKKKEGRFYYNFIFKEKPQKVILSQLRLFDVKRIEHKMGMISKEDFENIEKAIKSLIDDF